jgi:predicted O-methyltransferase YrrM
MLRRYAQAQGTERDQLQALYERYTREVSPSHMAASLEAACFLAVLCVAMKPKRIVDLGSGFSSAVFRHYENRTGVQTEVHSVDDSPEWLERTRSFLLSNALPSDNMATWESFVKQSPGSFDLMLYDLGNMETREREIQSALKLLAPGGIAVIDDVHNANYEKTAKRAIKALNMRWLSVRTVTLDSHYRFAGLALARPSR